jgi:hypothetical protein
MSDLVLLNLDLDDLDKEEIPCPMCGAWMVLTDEMFIEWDEEKRHFLISLKGTCGCDHYYVVKELPLLIARQSSCKCGSSLSLSSHKMKKVDDEFEFEAIYICPACADKKRSVINKLKASIEKFWRNTKAIEVSATGVKYEKAVPEGKGKS